MSAEQSNGNHMENPKYSDSKDNLATTLSHLKTTKTENAKPKADSEKENDNDDIPVSEKSQSEDDPSESDDKTQSDNEQSDEQDEKDEDEIDFSKVQDLKFRNYEPMDDKLVSNIITEDNENTKRKIKTKRKLSDSHISNTLSSKINVDRIVRESTENVGNIKVVPKKLNWDLKRDLSDVMEKLDRETDLCLEKLRDTDADDVENK